MGSENPTARLEGHVNKAAECNKDCINSPLPTLHEARPTQPKSSRELASVSAPNEQPPAPQTWSPPPEKKMQKQTLIKG